MVNLGRHLCLLRSVRIEERAFPKGVQFERHANGSHRSSRSK